MAEGPDHTWTPSAVTPTARFVHMPDPISWMYFFAPWTRIASSHGLLSFSADMEPCPRSQES